MANAPTARALERRLKRAERAGVGPKPQAKRPEPARPLPPQAAEDDDDETEWTATDESIEADAPAAAAEAEEDGPAEALGAREVTDADLDRLWDWIRKDSDGGAAFLGARPETYSQLQQRVALFDQLFALESNGVHIGFAGFSPVHVTQAGLHAYLSPDERGTLRSRIPYLMEMAQQTLPGRSFALATSDVAAARLYQSCGFTLRFMLTWAPPADKA